MKKILITGGAGFIGHHLIEQILKHTDWQITTLDRFDAAGNPNRLSEMLETTPGIDRSRVKFVFWDLKAALNERVIHQLAGPFDYIAHLAAGTHVDRSIDDPMSFFMDNAIGTVNLLNYARDEKHMPTKFLYFSTDEVFGPAPFDMKDGYREWDRHNPNNPYAAAKSAAEMAVVAFANTYHIPCVISNCMNVIGERQDPEKYVPMVINKLLAGQKLLVHADKTKTQPGLRHYLHARNISAAVIWILEHGKTLDGSGKSGRYNVVGDEEIDNLQMAQLIAEYVNGWRQEHIDPNAVLDLDYELVDFHSSRPGHDLRYALDGQLLKREGFNYPKAFRESLKSTVWWTLDHAEKWL